MNPKVNLEIDQFFDNIISSYEDRIQKIQTTFQTSENLTESSNSLYNNIHNTLNDLKKERDLLNEKLCETLAQNGSLRKKDYHLMMSGILDLIEEKEKEAEQKFLDFIEGQKETAHAIRNSLLGLKNITTEESTQQIKSVKTQLDQIMKIQELSKGKVMKSFLNFQQIHNVMTKNMGTLLTNSDRILVKDIKKVKNLIIKEINTNGQLAVE